MTIGGLQDSVVYTLENADGSIAVFNDQTDPNYVGMVRWTGLDDAEVREVVDDRTEEDGAVHGNFWRGRRPVVGNIDIVAESTTDRNTKFDRLRKASNALRGDATLTWTPDGSAEQFIRVRKNGPVRRSEGAGWLTQLQLPLVASDPFTYSTTLNQDDETAAGGSAAGLRATILSLSPELYYDFGDNGVTDLSGNSRDGTAQGGITVGGAAALTALTGDESTNFDGTNDYISTSYSPFVNGAALTVIAWIKRDNAAHTDMLFSGNGASSPAAWVNATTNDTRFDPQFGGTTPNDHFADWPAAWPGTNATMMAMTFDESTNHGQLYINGAYVSQGTANQAYGTSGNLQIGVGPFAFLDGQVSHFAVFERELSAAEVAAVYAAGEGGSYVNSGSAPTPPAIRLQDDNGGSDIQLTRVTETGESANMTLSGLDFTDYVEIDFAARTILESGVTNVYSALQAGSDWFKLEPGENTIFCTVDFEIDWRDAWL